MKDKFFLTFGNRYKHECHPSGYDINPDGWIEVLAYNYDLARQEAMNVFGQEWCWLYTEDEFEPTHFPAGKIGMIVSSGRWMDCLNDRSGRPEKER